MSGQIDFSPFIPPSWLPEGQSQTIVGSRFARHARIDFARQRIDTPDGDFIDLDWNIPGLHEIQGTQSTHSSTKHESSSALKPPLNNIQQDHTQQQAQANASPIPNYTGKALVLFHGLEGSSQSHYAQSICHDFRAQGWAVVVAHFRGCSGENNRLARSYFSGDTQDVAHIMQAIQERLPQAQWYAAGVSMGGNVLLKYAGEQGSALKHLQAIAAISAPLDLQACSIQLGQGFFSRAIYTPYFLIPMKKKMREKHQRWGDAIALDKILAVRSIWDFDDVYTGPIHGFTGALDYYTRCSSKPDLVNIHVPCLILNAQNDPFVPANSLPTAAEVSSSVTLHQPKHGGHVGFSQGAFPSQLGWLSQRLFDFFNNK